MTFSVKQMKKLIEIFQKNQAIFIGSSIGTQYLTDYDKFLLKLDGVDLDNVDTFTDIQKMFYFGIYSEFLGGNESYESSGAAFDKWLAVEVKKPLSVQKKASLEFLEKRTFNDIVGLGNRMANKYTNNILTTSLSQQNMLQNKIKDATIKSFKENYSSQQLASELRELTGDWARDFSRIADYVMQEAYAYGRLAQIIDTYGKDCEVYKQTFPGCCADCEKNYGTPNEEPIVYSIGALRINGTNIGRKEQLPVIGQAHPFARSILHPVPPDSVWDENKKQFVIIRNTQGIKRNSKVKINIIP